jgi:hypothetical protein
LDKIAAVVASCSVIADLYDEPFIYFGADAIEQFFSEVEIADM